MKLYFKWRYFFYNQWNWRYTIDYLFKEQRPDYDITINTYELNSPKNFVLVEFDDKYTVEQIRYDFDTFYKWLFNLAELTAEQAKVLLSTNYKEIEDGKFEISAGTTWLNWEIIPARYLIIE